MDLTRIPGCLTPVSSLHPGDTIDLEGDLIYDAEGLNPRCAEPLIVERVEEWEWPAISAYEQNGRYHAAYPGMDLVIYTELGVFGFPMDHKVWFVDGDC